MFSTHELMNRYHVFIGYEVMSSLISCQPPIWISIEPTRKRPGIEVEADSCFGWSTQTAQMDALLIRRSSGSRDQTWLCEILIWKISNIKIMHIIYFIHLYTYVYNCVYTLYIYVAAEVGPKRAQIARSQTLLGRCAWYLRFAILGLWKLNPGKTWAWKMI